MRVLVTGATGNVGTSVVEALEAEPAVDSIVGLARRLPGLVRTKTRWLAAEIRDPEFSSALQGVDAVVHLAWRIQPSTDPDELESVNVLGSERVFAAAAGAAGE